MFGDSLHIFSGCLALCCWYKLDPATLIFIACHSPPLTISHHVHTELYCPSIPSSPPFQFLMAGCLCDAKLSQADSKLANSSMGFIWVLIIEFFKQFGGFDMLGPIQCLGSRLPNAGFPPNVYCTRVQDGFDFKVLLSLNHNGVGRWL